VNRFADANFSDIAKEVDYHFQRAHLSYDEDDWMNLALEYYCDEVGAEFDQVDYDWFVKKMHDARKTKKVTVGTANRFSERISRVVRSLGASPDQQEMNERFSDFIYDKFLGERGQLQDYGECEFEHWGDDWGGFAGVHVTDKKNLYSIDFLLTPRGKMQATIHMPHWGAEDFISEEVVGRPEGAWLEFFNKMMLRFYGEIEKHLEGKATRTAAKIEWLIYNPKENLFWSNRDGWVDKDSATVFLDDEKDRYSHIPGVGSKWVPVDFKQLEKKGIDDGLVVYVPTSQVQEGRAPSSEKTAVRGNKRVTSIIIDDSNEGQVILDACCDLPNGEGNTSVNVTFYYKKVTLSHGEEGKLNLSFFAVGEDDTDIEVSLTKDMVEKIQENMFQWLIKGSL